MQYNTVERSWILRALPISKSAGKFQHLSIQYDQIINNTISKARGCYRNPGFSNLIPGMTLAYQK